MRRKRRWVLVLAVSAGAITAGCGGGGGDGGGNQPPPVGPPGAAVLALEFGLKQLRFSWGAVDGATSYRLLQNPDGSSGFTQLGDDIPAGETAIELDLSVHLHDWPNARYLLDACNAGGCTGSNEVGTTPGDALEAIGYFKNSNHEAGDHSAAIALSADGMMLAIGAPQEDSAATGIDGDQADNSAEDTGAVYVFRRIDGAWSQHAYLKASNADTGDGFGSSVALHADGLRLAVGAPGESSGASGVDGDETDNSVAAAGAVYVFERDDDGSWSQQAYIKASSPDTNDRFGGTLRLSGDGNTLAVAAASEDSAATGIGGNELDETATGAGAVYVFGWDDPGGWSQRAYVKAIDTDPFDRFGASLALDADGTTLAIGAHRDDSAAVGVNGDAFDDSALDSGAVFVYSRDPAGDGWQLEAYVKAPNTEAGDEFHSVALSGDGNTLAVGAELEDSAATGVDGAQGDNSAANAGAVYLYGRSGFIWSFQTYLKASNADAADQFGAGVTLSAGAGVTVSADGNTIAVGASQEAGGSAGIEGDQADDNAVDAGAVYVFRRNGASQPWSQLAYVKASNADTDDQFGIATALSSDGGTLAVLAPFEESAATGIGGNQDDDAATSAGAVYLY